MASNILKIEGTVSSTQLLSAPNRRFYTEKRDHLEPGTNLKYELISAHINNDIINPDVEDVKISIAAKLERKAEKDVMTEFCKVSFKKGQKSTGKGQGLATLKPVTLIGKLNAAVKSHPFLAARYENYTPFFVTDANKIEITLLPFMGLYLNHQYLFEDAFKLRNASLEKYNELESPKWFEKLAVEPERSNAENSSDINYIMYFEDGFYGLKNRSPRTITIKGDEAMANNRILDLSVMAKEDNEFFDKELNIYLDEVLYIAFDFFFTQIPVIQSAKRVSKLNTYSTLFPTVLASSLLNLFQEIDFTKFYNQTASDIKIEWIHGWLAITGSIDLVANTELHLTGNANTLKLLGFNLSKLKAVNMGEEEEAMYYFPRNLVHELKSNIILASNGPIENTYLPNAFPLYITLPYSGLESNILSSNSGNSEILALAMMHDHTNFTPLKVTIPLSRPLLIGICDAHERPLQFPINISLYLQCTVDL